MALFMSSEDAVKDLGNGKFSHTMRGNGGPIVVPTVKGFTPTLDYNFVSADPRPFVHAEETEQTNPDGTKQQNRVVALLDLQISRDELSKRKGTQFSAIPVNAKVIGNVVGFDTISQRILTVPRPAYVPEQKTSADIVATTTNDVAGTGGVGSVVNPVGPVSKITFTAQKLGLQ